ncbi:nose resistant to fluoxetine protein 6-like isoform X3 [Choristoneura fumiferana]|uniref:nose resistant to fluoxetine protein 6-like isoform X3 n=1 Tax=Choristoneura fumiferana TaxID=7141 RepID=UPI003D154DDD
MEYSAQTITHFNHTVVHRGVCMTQTCRQYLGNSTNLDQALEECLNATLYETHQLQVNLIKDKVECTYYNEKVEIDAGDCAVATIMALLFLMTAAGSMWDSKISENRHIGARILICFSLKRNWQRLTQPSGEGPEPRMQRLKCFNGIKTITTMLVIFGHSPAFVIIITNNPEFLEMSYHNPMYSILYGGTLIVQTFFIISGFLLAYNILLVEEKTKVDWKMLPKGLVLRWLRLTPPYAAMLALICTWSRHIGNGPFWKSIVGLEIKDCRSDWYYHLLYVNNFIDNSQCMAHTWYLAADMQLSVLGLLLFCLVSRVRARKMAVGAAIVLGLLTPAVHTYVQDLHPILILAPEVIRHLFVEDPTFNNLYKRGHTNLVCYALGLGLAMYIYCQQEKNIDIEKYKKYRHFYWATLPLGLLLVTSASVFYIDGILIPLAFRMVYSSAVKAIFGLIIITILLGNIFKIEKIYRPIMEWRGWAAPGRVSYCAFLVHITIIRTLLVNHTSLVHSSLYQIVVNYLGLLTSSFLLAFPLWMLVEAPCTQLVKVCLMPNSKKPGSNLESNKSVSIATQIVVLGSKKTIEVIS